MAKITLEFEDIDEFAETIWALIYARELVERGRHIEIGHETWLRMPEKGKEAARSIAREVVGIYGKPDA